MAGSSAPKRPVSISSPLVWAETAKETAQKKNNAAGRQTFFRIKHLLIQSDPASGILIS
jgi:hypothetical protein